MNKEELKKMLEQQAQERKAMNKLMEGLADMMALSGEPISVYLAKYQHFSSRLGMLADAVTDLKNEKMIKEATSLISQFDELLVDLMTEYNIKFD